MDDSWKEPAQFSNGHDVSADLGWRRVLGVLGTSVEVENLSQAVDVAARAAEACGADGDGRLNVDIRHGRVVLTLHSVADAEVTSYDVELAGRISTAIADMGLRTWLGTGDGTQSSAQVVELVVDAVDIPAVRAVWQAALGYDDERDSAHPEDPLVDPLGQCPAVSFRRIDPGSAGRGSGVRIDVAVGGDETDRRLRAAKDAGATIVPDETEPDCWLLTDAEGNEVTLAMLHGGDA
ncbi:VOC family protein [Phytoactinopolyspora halotolerans]|uniref:4a-hydroxytetrahydrobiopterin dehydratase n=1 Tax=Phytoactinopolyspora halotolerans TaxID=1981512 RepID=A0A6L9SEJ7_9ACTN|nr:VOC family protein [Phytoactinopolyspora halotolerans]NEE03054.1 4a-hydroxytetrahydrobiopterin dehydratase [Phytoactinopolyspora halotolerans]